MVTPPVSLAVSPREGGPCSVLCLGLEASCLESPQQQSSRLAREGAQGGALSGLPTSGRPLPSSFLLSPLCVHLLVPGFLPFLHLGPRRWALGPCSCGRLGVETLSAVTPKGGSQSQARSCVFFPVWHLRASGWPASRAVPPQLLKMPPQGHGVHQGSSCHGMGGAVAPRTGRKHGGPAVLLVAERQRRAGRSLAVDPAHLPSRAALERQTL